MRHRHLELLGFEPSQLPSDSAAPNQGVAAPAFRWKDHPEEFEVSPRNMLDELLRIRENERQHLAQELHDSAGQLLVALELSIAHLKQVEKDGAHEDLFEEIQEAVRQIDREIRSLAFLHYPVELADRTLPSALQSLALGFGRRTGIHTTFRCLGDRSTVEERIAMAILRVTQEALVNIHRHAHASLVRVVLKRQADRLHLTVCDDGVGFPAAVAGDDAHGIGLQGMHRRIEMLGGQLRIRNLKRGAKLSAVVPVPMAGSAGF